MLSVRNDILGDFYVSSLALVFDYRLDLVV